jgi:hypothetical protein
MVEDFWVKNYSACPLIQIGNSRRKREIGRKGGEKKENNFFFDGLIMIHLSCSDKW